MCLLPAAAGSRARYVDVLNPGGRRQTEPALAPADFFAPLAPLPIPAHLCGPHPGRPWGRAVSAAWPLTSALREPGPPPPSRRLAVVQRAVCPFCSARARGALCVLGVMSGLRRPQRRLRHGDTSLALSPHRHSRGCWRGRAGPGRGCHPRRARLGAPGERVWWGR